MIYASFYDLRKDILRLGCFKQLNKKDQLPFCYQLIDTNYMIFISALNVTDSPAVEIIWRDKSSYEKSKFLDIIEDKTIPSEIKEKILFGINLFTEEILIKDQKETL